MLNYVLGGSLDGRGAGGRRDTRVCMAKSRCWMAGTLTTLLTTCAPMYSKKLKRIGVF